MSNPRFAVSFSELLTLCLEKGATHHVTRLPRFLLSDYEKPVVEFLQYCADQGFCPTVEQVQENFNFVPKKPNFSLEVAYDHYTETIREKYVTMKQMEYMEENRAAGKPEYDGLVTFLKGLLDKTAIPNVRMISYKDFDRSIYEHDILSLEWHIPYFDDLTNKLVGGDFIVILAATKTGKTTLIKLAAQGAFEHGETVMFCSQEQAVIRMAQQFDMQKMGMVHSNLRHGIDDETKVALGKLQEAVRKNSSNIYITPQVKSVAQLHEYIQACEVKPTKVFIDGLNLMQESQSADSYSSLAQVSQNLKEYANQHNICIIAVTQTNRAGAKAGDMVDATSIAGSFAIAMFADIMIAMTPKPEDDGKEKLNHVYIRTILHRHGEAGGVKIRMTPRYNKITSKFSVEFAELDPNWSPEQTNISYSAKKRAIAQFESLTGTVWTDLTPEQQDAVMDTSVGELAND